MKSKFHASCAARDDDGVLLLGPSGSGKSDLLLRLIDRGFVLVADDQVSVEDGRASPAHRLEGLIEVRGLGILRLPWRRSARLRLACELGQPVPRMPRPMLHPLGIPLLRLDAAKASAALLVAHALDCLDGRTNLLDGALAGPGASPGGHAAG